MQSEQDVPFKCDLTKLTSDRKSGRSNCASFIPCLFNTSMKLCQEEPSLAAASVSQFAVATTTGTTADTSLITTNPNQRNKKMKYFHDPPVPSVVALDSSVSLSMAKSTEGAMGTSSPTNFTLHADGYNMTVQPIDDESESSTESLSCSGLFESFSIRQNEQSSPRSTITPCSSSHSYSSKRVSFTVVQVQEYALTLGDHPYADSYPLSLDWEHTPVKEMPLRDYETSRDALRRNSSPIFSSSSHRGHLTPMQRRIRLSKVAGLQPAELTRQEQHRIQKLILDHAQDHESDFDVDECDKPFQETIDAIPADTNENFVMDDYVFLDDFDPIEVSRSTSLSELDIDGSLLEYLYDSDDEEAGGVTSSQCFRRSRRHSAP